MNLDFVSGFEGVGFDDAPCWLLRLQSCSTHWFGLVDQGVADIGFSNSQSGSALPNRVSLLRQAGKSVRCLLFTDFGEADKASKRS